MATSFALASPVSSRSPSQDIQRQRRLPERLVLVARRAGLPSRNPSRPERDGEMAEARIFSRRIVEALARHGIVRGKTATLVLGPEAVPASCVAGTLRRRRIGRALPRREGAARQVLGDQTIDEAVRSVLARDVALQRSPAGSNAPSQGDLAVLALWNEGTGGRRPASEIERELPRSQAGDSRGDSGLAAERGLVNRPYKKHRLGATERRQ